MCQRKLFHDWSKWQVINEGPLKQVKESFPDKIADIGRYIDQERTCQRCGYKQVKCQSSKYP